VRKGDASESITLLEILQEVSTIDNTRNQLIHTARKRSRPTRGHPHMPSERLPCEQGNTSGVRAVTGSGNKFMYFPVHATAGGDRPLGGIGKGSPLPPGRMAYGNHAPRQHADSTRGADARPATRSIGHTANTPESAAQSLGSWPVPRHHDYGYFSSAESEDIC
jgi:hypothetical protein